MAGIVAVLPAIAIGVIVIIAAPELAVIINVVHIGFIIVHIIFGFIARRCGAAFIQGILRPEADEDTVDGAGFRTDIFVEVQ